MNPFPFTFCTPVPSHQKKKKTEGDQAINVASCNFHRIQIKEAGPGLRENKGKEEIEAKKRDKDWRRM